MKYRSLLMAVIGVSLVGCSYSAVEEKSAYQGEFKNYACQDDKSFKVAYMPNEPKALLRLPENDYRLARVRSGSGSKYILDDGTSETINPVTLFTKGNEARLELGRVIYKNCMTEE
ncbi:MliC family protein [Vibrio sp. TBV020]|uniref:MliC family protein n=1 Tax=Vibrio sp. TBV020 TaxID=3137398 RepID=UPI0038CDC5DE